MKIVFFGNADFGSNTLKFLISSKYHEVVGVVTNEDKRVGRNKKTLSTSIKKIALDRSVPIFEVGDFRDESFLNKLESLKADVFIVIAYKIIPKNIYMMPRYGAINLHASLLPEYRGPSPIQRCLIDNRSRTGLSSFFINKSIDRGELIYQKKIKVSTNDTFYDLWKKLSNEGPAFIDKTLKLVKRGKVDLIDEKLAPSYAPKIDKKELLINWTDSADQVYHQIRAFSPYPCMYTLYCEKRIKIVSAKLIKDKKKAFSFRPGELITLYSRLLVGCSDFLIEILKLKPESKGILCAEDFINGFLNKKQNKIKFFN